jgi:hypothetical protein
VICEIEWRWKERQQVVADLPGVVEHGVLAQLSAAVLEPLRREGMEARVARAGSGNGQRPDPDAPLDIGQDMTKLALSAFARPSVSSRAERDVLALAVGAEPQCERPPLAGLLLDDLAGGLRGHQTTSA